MAADPPVWNLTEAQWADACERARRDALDDGAYVRAVPDSSTGRSGLDFYATSLNAPPGWSYPFLEPIPDTGRLGATVGYAWHEPETGFVQFEVTVPAAAQSLRAAYESGTADLDYVAYEQAVDQAVRGTPADAAWLHHEFARLLSLAPHPAR